MKPFYSSLAGLAKEYATSPHLFSIRTVRGRFQFEQSSFFRSAVKLFNVLAPLPFKFEISDLKFEKRGTCWHIASFFRSAVKLFNVLATLPFRFEI